MSMNVPTTMVAVNTRVQTLLAHTAAAAGVATSFKQMESHVGLEGHVSIVLTLQL